MIRIIKTADYEQMSQRAAKIIADLVAEKPDCVLGLATGSSPIGTYQELVRRNKEEGLSFAKVSSANLDEYVGLSGDHDQSYRYFMNTNLFDHVDIDKTKTHVPNGLAEDAKAEGTAYDAMVRSMGGTDLQLLGLGHNGHIGFNEPGDAFIKETHEVDLTRSTIEANARLFDSIDEVPRKAITMGMGTIMNAKKILVVVNGEGKAKAVKDSFFGPITPQVPASILQLHADVTVVADEAALSLCGLIEEETIID